MRRAHQAALPRAAADRDPDCQATGDPYRHGHPPFHRTRRPRATGPQQGGPL